MKKGAIITIPLFLALISFAKAATFSVSDLLDKVDSSTIVLGAVFMIFFAFIFFVFSKLFTKRDKYGYKEPQTGIATVMALSISLLIVYGLNKLGWNFEDIFFNLGFSSDLVYLLILLIFVGGAVFLGIKTKWNLLLILGVFFIIISMLNLIYETTLMLVIGVILIFIYLGIKFLGKKGKNVSIEERRKR
jgi:hypothetical protein